MTDYIRPFYFLCVFLITFACTNQRTSQTDRQASFAEELLHLKDFYHIPGLAVLVKEGEEILFEDYFGYADLEQRTPLDSAHVFPIASISKTFASVLLFQLIEEGKLSLDTPINTIVENENLPTGVLVKHLLSHTSQGEIGHRFLYSYRYGILTEVIEKVSGFKMETLVQEQIISPLGLTSTAPFTSDSLLDQFPLAKPYTFYGETEEGYYDPGYSASSGLISTVRDLALFDNALSGDKLISEPSRQTMFQPFIGSDGAINPYGYGIFAQEFMGEKLVWGYGQNDCFSSLMLKVPARDLTLILLANNNLMSDPPRLINGDVTYSLFALYFLKHFVFDLTTDLSFEDYQAQDLAAVADVIKSVKTEEEAFFRQELLAHSLGSSFLGRADSTLQTQSASLMQLAVSRFPDVESYGSLTMLYNLMTLVNDTGQRAFGEHFERLSEALQQVSANDPYGNVYAAFYYANKGEDGEAAQFFHRIADANNFSPFWYTIEAWHFLGQFYKETDPVKARGYFQQIVNMNWNYAGYLDQAKAAIEDLTQAR